ncbi:hypothetical protein H0W32_01775, partial [Patescibacteria group bacterium]|nr:hypothetical protein [Patescibacteria group bacterium]
NGSGISFNGLSQGIINHSSISHNNIGMSSNSTIAIDAQNNFWGSASGPYQVEKNPQGKDNAVQGTINFIPWLIQSPFVATSSVCCSNVLFLPGLEASRLYKERIVGGDDQLWEPNINSDVQDLFLDTTGKSLNKNIFTKDIIGRTNLPVLNIDIYRTFFDSLDTLVSNKSINGWDAYPYDWRMDVRDIVKNGTKIKGGQSDLVVAVERMASQSKTKKVTLITHSNGGLLAKALVQELEATGKAHLIDRVIMVAAPQLGTPKALGVILHGIDHSLGHGVVLTERVARSLGENMPGAYNLVPSPQYFSESHKPIVYFDPTLDTISNLRLKYGNTISTWDAMTMFMNATLDGRTKPIGQTNIPNIANTSLLAASGSLHESIDTWNFPTDIRVIQIIGNNIDTVEALRYFKKSSYTCILTVCNSPDTIGFSPVFTTSGDGTVTALSGSFGLSTAYTIDIAAYNKVTGENRSHADMMEMNSVQSLLKNIMTQQTDTVDTVHVMQAFPLVRAHIHSLAVMDLFDGQGRHTGALEDSASSTIRLYETKIPNSYYFPFGEGVYSGMNNESGSTIKISGRGIGTFTLNVEYINNDQSHIYSFEDVPVLPETRAEVVLENNNTLTLAVDLDGNGTKDFSVDSQNSFDSVAYLSVMKSVILTLDIPQKTKDSVLSKIDKIIKKIQTNKIEGVNVIIRKYIKRIEFKNKFTKTISHDDATNLIAMFNELLDAI